MPAQGMMKKFTDFFQGNEPTPGSETAAGSANAAPVSSRIRQRERGGNEPHEYGRSPLKLNETREGGVEIRHPRTLDDRMTVGNDLKNRRLVTLDLNRMTEADASRFLEFTYGLVFALDARVEKVSEGIFFLAPHGVDVRNDNVASSAAETPSVFTAPRYTAPNAGAANGTTGMAEEFWPKR